MEQSEIEAALYTGAKSPSFKLNSGQELDYHLAITMVKGDKSRNIDVIDKDGFPIY